jgi:hypothetical protein
MSDHLFTPDGDAVPPTFGFKPTELEAFHGTGYEFIPLHAPDALDAKGRSIGKAPHKGWRSEHPLSVAEAQQHMREAQNVGVRLRPSDLVVDVDPRNFVLGDDPVKRLEAALDVRLDDWPHVVTGSGGDHFYMTVPSGFLAADSLEDYCGIEFKGHGRQVVAPGSSHPDTRSAYTWDDDAFATPIASVRPAPQRLMQLIERPNRLSATETGDVTPEQLADMLEALTPIAFSEHAKWLELMMACHHATGGDGREEFIAWSTSDPVYSSHGHEIGRRWDSLHSDRAGRKVTQRTLFKALADAGRIDLIPQADPVSDFQEDVEDEVIARIAAEQCTVGSKPSKAGGHLSDKWVWVTRAEQFIHRTDCQRLSPFQFKSHYQHRWPDGDILAAVWRGKLPIRKFDSCAYVPGGPEVIAGGKWDGCYNTWRKGGVNAKRDDALAQMFLDHMTYLLPDAAERSYALDYLSCLVRDEFVKVHVAMLLQGAPGTGKSFVGSVVERMIGARNSRMVKSQELTKEFTAWQEDRQLAVIEEIMARGRIELVNELKTVITGETLRIRRMRTDTYEVPNGLNLLCFTNHENAVPIERGDRRWLALFSPAEPKGGAYYADLFDALNGDAFPAAVKWMLQNRKTGLNPKGMAPMTAGKSEMRRRSTGEVEQYLDEKLEERVGPFAFDLVRLDDVWHFVKGDFRGTRDLRGRVGDWLKSAGAMQHTAYKKQDGTGRPGYRLWSFRDQDQWEEAGAAKRIDAWLAYNGGPLAE